MYMCILYVFEGGGKKGGLVEETKKKVRILFLNDDFVM